MKESKAIKAKEVHNRIQGKTSVYLKMPIYLCILLFGINAWAYTRDVVFGILLSGVITIYLLVTILIYRYIKNRYLQELVDFAVDYTQVQKRLIKDLELPYGLLDKTGRFLWTNNSFKEIATDIEFKQVSDVFREVSEDEFQFIETNQKTYNIVYNERYYRVEFNKIEIDDDFLTEDSSHKVISQEYLLAIYMFDETDMKVLAKENVEQKMVAGLIYIDNYDDAQIGRAHV